MKNKLWVLVLIAGAIAIYYFTKGGEVNDPGDPAGGTDPDTTQVDTTNVAPPEPAAVTQ